MDPITLLAAAVPLRAAVPELAEIMVRWISQTADKSVKLRVVGQDGVEFVDLTPANAEALVKNMEAQPEGITIKEDSTRSATGLENTAERSVNAEALLKNKKAQPEGIPIKEDSTRSATGPENTAEHPVNAEALLKNKKAQPKSITIGGNVLGSAVAVGSRNAATLTYPSPITTERLDPESLRVALVQETLTRMHEKLGTELPRARSRERLVKRVRLTSSLAALISNVSVLGALGLGNTTASVVAAVIALLVSGLKTVEDHLIAGVTGKDPSRLQAMVIESTRLSYEAAEVISTFKRLNAARAAPKQYPLTDANRIAKDLLRILPEMEMVQNS